MTVDLRPAPDAASPPPVEESIRALFREKSGDTFDARAATLEAQDPARWDGIAFPVEFALELAAVCNLECVMCPVPTTIRPKELMKPELFHRVVDEIADETGYVLLPQGFGETMLHPQWAELVGYAKERGIGPIIMLTNGTVLTEKNVQRVLELGVEALIVSIDGTTPETYAALRVGGKLDKVEANVRRLIEARGEATTPKICMRIIRMKDTEDQIQAFFDRWVPLLHPSDEVRINEYNDWAGKVDDFSVEGLDDNPNAGRGPCRMLWRNLSVHADGKVSACCHDSEDELIVGDLAAGETVREVWNGEKLDALRRIHREGRFAELPICQACKAWY